MWRHCHVMSTTIPWCRACYLGGTGVSDVYWRLLGLRRDLAKTDENRLKIPWGNPVRVRVPPSAPGVYAPGGPKLDRVLP